MYLFRYRIPLKCAPYWREGLLLESEIGWGEIAPLPNFSRETLAEAEEEIKRLLPKLKRGETVTPQCPSVQFGIASALKPSPNRTLHLPLAALITGENLVAKAETALKEGFQTLKVKLSGLPIEEAIKAVREIQKTGATLRLDLNRYWTFDQACAFVSHFAPNDFAYLEEPLADAQQLKHFTEKTGFPVAVDESLLENINPIFAKTLVVKPTLLGNIPAGNVVLSAAYETGVGLLRIAELSDLSIAIGLDTYRQLGDDVLENPITCKNGFFHWEPPFGIKREKLCSVL